MAERAELADVLHALIPRQSMLALAGCLMLRDLARSLDTVKPATRDAVAVVEAWVRGTKQLDDVARARKAAIEPSPLVVALYRLALEILDEDLAPSISLLASLVPWTGWAATAEGRAYLETHRGSSQAEMMKVPGIARAVVGRQARLVAVIQHVVGDARDDDAAVARYDAWLRGDAVGLPQAIIAHDRLAEHPPTPSDGDRVLIEAVTEHVGRNVAPVTRVFHDKDNRWVHLDVHVVARPDEVVLVTSGMAERPLFPLSSQDRVFTELVMRLPAGWRHGDADLADPTAFWPFGWLRFLGRTPHRHAVAYRPRETSGPMSRPDGPRATDFDGVLFLRSTLVPALPIVGRTVEFLAVCPLYPAELELARARGTETLLEQFRAHGLDPERVEVSRPEMVSATSAVC